MLACFFIATMGTAIVNLIVMQKEKERIWALISRKLAKEASPEELLELQQLIDGNYKAGLVLEILMELFKSPGRQSEPIQPPDAPPAFDMEAGYQQVLERIRKEDTRPDN